MLKLTVHVHKLQKTVLGRRILEVLSNSEKLSGGLAALKSCGAGEFPKDIETLLLSMNTSGQPPASVFVAIRTQLEPDKTLDLVSGAKPIHAEGTYQGVRLVNIASGAALTFLGSDLLLSSLENIKMAIDWGQKRASLEDGNIQKGDFIQEGVNLDGVSTEHMIHFNAETDGIVKKLTSKLPSILQGIQTWQLLLDLEDEELVILCSGGLDGEPQAKQATEVLNGMILLGVQSGMLQKLGFSDLSQHIKISSKGKVVELQARLPFGASMGLISLLQSRVAPPASKPN